MATNKDKKEYSKVLLIQESVLLWVNTIAMLGLAYLSILLGYLGTLPWLAAMVGFPWTAYGVSQAMYYRKSEKENTKNGIKYEAVMAEINSKYNNNWNVVEQYHSYYDEGIDINLDYGI